MDRNVQKYQQINDKTGSCGAFYDDKCVSSMFGAGKVHCLLLRLLHHGRGQRCI